MADGEQTVMAEQLTKCER